MIWDLGLGSNPAHNVKVGDPDRSQVCAETDEEGCNSFNNAEAAS